jgi:hypothetical protein
MKTWILIGCLLLASCASSTTVKGGLQPFGEEGITDAASQASRRYALVVGIDDFDDERFRDLRYAGADARAFAGALSGFDDVQVLADPDQTDRASILSALRTLRDRAAGPSDVLVVYLSTHGTLASAPGHKLERTLVASDTRLDLASSTGIPVSRVLEELSASRSRRTALILAACHSGTGKSALDDDLADALARNKSALPPLVEVSQASIVLSAASFAEAAREEEDLGHDVYTYFLLEGIERGDRNGDGAVTASEAHDYARARTYAYTKGAQRPSFASSIVGDDPIVFRGSFERAGQPVLYSYAPSSEGLEVRVDGTAKGILPGGVAVETGRHEVELRDASSDRRVWRGSVSLGQGDHVELSDVVGPPPRLSVDAGIGAFAPTGPAIRGDYLSVAPRISGRLALVHVPWKWSYAELRYAHAAGAAETTAFDVALPFVWHSDELVLGGGAAMEIARGLDVYGGLDVGYTWASRRFDTATYSSEESFKGVGGSGFTGLDWTLFRHLVLGARANAGAWRAPIGGGLGPHPFVTVEFLVGGALH